MRLTLLVVLSLSLGALATTNASATFHFMQIEQILGGVDGSTDVQAIQLRMRFGGQNLVAQSRLVAHDANGANPVILVDMEQNVADGAAGARVLIASADFESATNPPLTPDFLLTNAIPGSYLDAGSITFESDAGSIYWRVSWGGGNYLGSGSGLTTNDSDGNFNPPFGDVLPSASDAGLLFQNGTSALSTTNADDYALTDGASVWTNNNGETGEILSLVDVGESSAGNRLALSVPWPNPVGSSLAYTVTLPREARARVAVFDLSGRLLHTVVDQTLAAGPHRFRWSNASSLSSGVYFLGLEVDGERRVQRFVVVR